jgi:predicted nucleic acid-binding protein
MGVLIDTDIWVDVERGALAPADIAAVTGAEPVFLSPVTIAELKFGAEPAPRIPIPGSGGWRPSTAARPAVAEADLAPPSVRL